MGMTPDYEYNGKCHIRFFNCDNMDVMKEVEDKKYAISLVDPPYGIGEDGSKNHTRCKLAKSKNYKPYSGNDKEPPTIEYFNELFRISKNQIIWGANHFDESLASLYISSSDNPSGLSSVLPYFERRSFTLRL